MTTIIKKVQSKSVDQISRRPPAPEYKVNRLSLDGNAFDNPNCLEKHWDSQESGMGSLPTIPSYLTQDNAGEAALVGHPHDNTLEQKVPQPNSSLSASMGRSNDFEGSNGPREAETSTGCKYPETLESLDGSPVQHIFDRSPSNFSELSLTGTEGSQSVRSSIDSAICLDLYHPRSRKVSPATNRTSMYSVISSDIIHEMPESPLDTEEGIPQVSDVNADEHTTNLQATVTSRLQANEEAPVECNTTTDKPRTPRMVKLIRFILRIVNTCIRTPQVRSECEPSSFDYGANHKFSPPHAAILGHIESENPRSGYENFAFTEHVEAEATNERELADNNSKFINYRRFGNANSYEEGTYSTSKGNTGNINSHGVDCSLEVITNVNQRTFDFELQKPTFLEFTSEKKNFLKSFEWMLEQAQEQGIDVVGHVFQIANFAAAILDCHGGCLSIDDLDVHLYVPPDAIPVEQTQQVYIFVTGTSKHYHYFLTPFVHCGPADAVFNKDVVLTMPHCVKDTPLCEFSSSKLSSGGHRELREGADVITVVDNGSITLSVNHFCGFGATASPVNGTILTKSMIACVFIHEESHSDEEVQIRLRLVDDINAKLQEVKLKESMHGFHLADMESPLIVQKNDQDVVAEISNCIKSWNISEPESCQQKFHRDMLWRETTSCAQASPSVMFFAKRCSGCEKVSFKAQVKIYQEGCESSDYGVDFVIVGVKKRDCFARKLDQETQMEQTKQTFLNQLLQLKRTEKSVARYSMLEKPIFDKLCGLMDAPNPLDNDWKTLTRLLLTTGYHGGSANITSIIDAKAGREQRSPTEIVLELFFGKQSGKKKEETMKTLKRALTDMHRQDAVDVIDEWLQNCSDCGMGETRGSCPISTQEIPAIEITTDLNANLNADDKTTKSPLNRKKDSAYISGVSVGDKEAFKELH